MRTYSKTTSVTLFSCISEYLSFKKQLLLQLTKTDGLGLLQSGIFEKYETLTWGTNLEEYQSQQQTRFQNNEKTELTKLKANDKEWDLPLQINIQPRSKNNQSFYQQLKSSSTLNVQNIQQQPNILENRITDQSIYKLQIHQFLSNLKQNKAFKKSLSKTKQILQVLHNELPIFIHSLISNFEQTIKSQEQQIHSLRTNNLSMQTTRRSEKQIGKRELILIVNEKNLQKKKQQLERLQKVLRQKQTQIEEQKLHIRNLENSNISSITSNNNHSQSLYDIRNQDFITRERIDLLNEKVKFQGFKKDTLFELGKQNSMLQGNILPRLENLRNRMNIRYQ